MRSVYLCGFMGCGKSTLGKALARRLEMDFVDLDEYIVEHEKRSIPEIFEQNGEPHFRELEAKYICELESGFVVATGGGALQNDNTAEFANQSGLVVFIDQNFDTCYQRIRGDKNRPLVTKNSKEQLKALFDARHAIYEKNSAVIFKADTSVEKNADELSKIVTSALRRRG